MKKPIMTLAPMADVTDPAYRRVIAKYGKPDVMWTEFVSADGLIRADAAGKEKLMRDLIYTEEERPIVAQLFTADPEIMRKAAKLVAELGFDGLDINMGCPDRSIEKQGAGAAMIKTPVRAVEVIEAARAGVIEAGSEIPVTVKTRIGYARRDEFEPWMKVLLAQNLPVISLHARTRKEMSKVPADWSYVARLVALRDELAPETRIIGNGDVLDWDDAHQKVVETNCDGVMFGRAIFGNPWLFADDRRERAPEEKICALVEIAELFEELLPHKNFAVMKKHFKAFINGWDGAKELRAQLMEEGNSSADMRRILGL